MLKLMKGKRMQLYKTEEWHEDFGDCLFFHFYDFESAPDSLLSSPISSDFETEHPEGYWTHFIKIDLNSIIGQASGRIIYTPKTQPLKGGEFFHE